MLNNVTLTNEELYFIGKRTGGSHLNYKYIADMEDIGQRKAMVQEKIKDALVAKGYATENLWGDTEINAEVVSFLHPVFDGHREAVLEIQDNTDEQGKAAYLFHMDDENLIMVKKRDKLLIFQKMDRETLTGFITSLIPQDYNEIMLPNESKVSASGRSIVGQYLEFGKSAEIRTINIVEGQIFYLDEEDKTHLLDESTFFQEIYDLITGGNTSGIS